MNGNVDWTRTAKSLHDLVRHRRASGDPDAALVRAQRIMAACGSFTQTRVMAQRLALACLPGVPTVILPACPDYAHNGERYTFQGSLGTGVSLLAQRQISFLEPLLRDGLLHGELLYADQEASDAELCAAAGLDPSEFHARVCASMNVTKAFCLRQSLPVTVRAMTDRFPDLGARERLAADRITAERSNGIMSDAIARSSLYRRINPRMDTEEMIRRTARTAAQYVALGEAAAACGVLIANHSTVNLRWYLKTDVGVLHNPVDVY